MALGADDAEFSNGDRYGTSSSLSRSGIGLLLTFALSRYLRSQLLEVSPYDL